MAGYTRQSTYTDGDIIDAADSNDEFDQLLASFNASSGHTHDGTSAEGAPITKLLSNTLTFGAATSGTDITVTFDGESNDGVLKWMEDEDYFEFSDDILVASTEKIQFRDTAIYINSSADGQLDLVADTEIQIAATTIDMNGAADISGNLAVGGNLTVAGNATVTGTTTFNGGTLTLGDSASDNVVFGADVDSHIIPDDDDTFDLGSSSQQWRNIYIDGSAYIDGLAEDILVATDKKVGFRDSAIYINSSADGQLDIVADTEIQIAATTIDINGAINASGEIIAASLDISGNIDVDGTTNLDVVDIDGAVNIAAATTVATDNKIQFRDTGLYINSSTDGQLDIVADTEVQIAATTVDINGAVDVSGNLSVGGNLDVTGTFDLSDSNFTNAGDIQLDSITGDSDTNTSIAFSGSDVITVTTGGETQVTFNNGSILPTTDNDVDLGSSSLEFKDLYIDGTAYVDAINFNGTAISATAAELNIMDGVTSTAAELNILDGVTSTAAELNILDGVTSTAAELNILDGVTATTAEINLIDGDTSRGTTAVASGDGILINDAGTMRMTNVDTVSTYFASHNVGGGNIVTTGALNSGSITSGFGAIDNGSSNITTTGVGSFGSLDISGAIDVDGTTNLDAVDIDGAVDMADTLQVTGVATLTATAIANAGVSVKNGATSAGFVEFFEDSDNGSNKVTLIGPASTADVTLTLPAAAGTVATTDDATALAIALG
jgi:cytoskeletal protein CcmA (bactofilin family)